MTQKTSSSVIGDSTELIRKPLEQGDFADSHRLRFQSEDYWRAFFSHPAHDFAEAVIRLRRKRGLSQEELSEKIGSHQPAVARLESGDGNPRLDTLVELAAGLDACVRVEVVPLENLKLELRSQPWFFSKSVKHGDVVKYDAGAIHSIDSHSFITVGESKVWVELSAPDQLRVAANNNFALAG